MDGSLVICLGSRGVLNFFQTSSSLGAQEGISPIPHHVKRDQSFQVCKQTNDDKAFGGDGLGALAGSSRGRRLILVVLEVKEREGGSKAFKDSSGTSYLFVMIEGREGRIPLVSRAFRQYVWGVGVMGSLAGWVNTFGSFCIVKGGESFRRESGWTHGAKLTDMTYCWSCLIVLKTFNHLVTERKVAVFVILSDKSIRDLLAFNSVQRQQM